MTSCARNCNTQHVSGAENLRSIGRSSTGLPPFDSPQTRRETLRMARGAGTLPVKERSPCVDSFWSSEAYRKQDKGNSRSEERLAHEPRPPAPRICPIANLRDSSELRGCTAPHSATLCRRCGVCEDHVPIGRLEANQPPSPLCIFKVAA